MGEDLVPGLQLRPKASIGESLGDDGLNCDRFFFRHALLLGTAVGSAIALGPRRVAASLALALA